MSTPSSVHRSPERSTQVAFRVTPRDRSEIHKKAASYGMTLQDYLTWKALELDEAPVPLRDGRKPRARPTPDLFEEKLSA
ncbi:plasmid mobilization protein [Dermacoccus nishinomiyaensis]|uniref:plasmid mobilization protein n=1 Tax=Dermacoccus nishinomiyaensis TaxID=1274 RepID=UPI000B10791B